MRDFVRRISVPLFLACALALFVNLTARADDSGSLFNTKCAACHDSNGSGSGRMGKMLGAKDLRSEAVQKKTNAELEGIIANGISPKMPAYKDKLTEEQIKGLVGYIRELAKKK